MYTVQQAKEEIKAGVQAYLMKDKNGTYCYKETARMPFYLEGKPGMGKTEIVRQIAEELGIGFVSFSITHHTRNTLLGLPVIVEEEGWKYTEYTMSEIVARLLAEQKKGHEEGILLLDEFNCASETIFPMMLAMLQTRNIGYYKIPDGWNIVLCGNPREFNKSARNLDAAIWDRVRKIQVEEEVKEFLAYAEEKKMHPVVIRYLGANRVNLYYYDTSGEADEVVTCRGWENLSHMLYAYEALGNPITENTVKQFIKSEEIAYSFFSYYQMNRDGAMDRMISDVLNEKGQNRVRQELKGKKMAYLCNFVAQLEKKIEELFLNGRNEEETSGRITNALRFFDEPDYEVTYKEQLFRQITDSEVLQEVLISVRNEDYLSMCRRLYGLDERRRSRG